MTNDAAVLQALPRRMLLGLAAAASGLTLVPAAHAEQEYGLDDISRRVPKRGRLVCPDIELAIYRGTHIRYAQAAKIYVGFTERLAKMELVARETAIDTYGRAPRRLQHIGTYSCRRIGKYPTWISEHALGNGIDVLGFDFPALGRKDRLPEGVPRVLRRAFAVRVQSHWKAKRGPIKLHAKFLRTFAKRLIARKDIFRVLLGPAFPGHHNHFHFDCAPWRIVDVFEADR